MATDIDKIALAKRIDQAKQVIANQDTPRATWPWSLQLLDYLREEAEAVLASEPDYPEFEYAVEYDEGPLHHYYDDAAGELEKGGGAPPTMADIRKRAAEIAYEHAELTEVYLLCPYPDCQETDTIVEVDSSIRWNDIEVELCTEGEERRITGIHVTASTGRDGASEFDHFLCTACTREVAAPNDFEIESYD